MGKILEEAYNPLYFIHPKATEMYHDIRERYWCYCLKRDTIEFLSEFLNCQQVKAENLYPRG